MELESNVNLRYRAFYQSMVKDPSQRYEVSKAFINDTSRRLVHEFVDALSDGNWLQKNASHSLEGLKLIPKSYGKERQRLVQAIASTGLFASIDHEIKQMVIHACGQRDFGLVLNLMPYLKPFSMEKGRSVLHDIAAFGTTRQLVEACRLMVAHGYSIDCRDNEGNTPLHLAARVGKDEAVMSLLRLGASVEARNNEGDTPLHQAASNGKMNATNKLISAGANVNAVDSAGNTPLHHAAWEAELGVMKALLQAGAQVNAKNTLEETPLHKATHTGNLQTVRLLVRRGADLNATTKELDTPLYYAVLQKDRNLVECFMSLGANVDIKNIEGMTPLHHAAHIDDCGMITILLAHGASLEARDIAGSTPLLLAALQGNSDATDLLIENGAKTYCRDVQGNTLLHMAAFGGNVRVIKSCLYNDTDIDVNAPNNFGNTPLHMAMLREGENMVEVTQLLIDYQAQTEEHNKFGETPLHLAAGVDKDEEIEVLVRAGAQINALDHLNNAPILVAAARKEMDTAIHLYELGADLRNVNSNGITPLMCFLISDDIGSELLEELIQKDDGFTAEILERKLLAHRFGLKGKSEIAGSYFQLEGWYADQAVAHLSLSMDQFYAQLKADLKGKTGLWTNILQELPSDTREVVKELRRSKMTKILNTTLRAASASASIDIDKAMASLAKGNPVGIATGWEEHLVGMAVHDSSLAVCNRGEDCGAHPGVVVYKINSPKNLKKSLECIIPTGTKTYLLETMATDLQLSFQAYLPQKAQKVGNCAVANTNSMEIALLYLQLEPLIGQQAAKRLAKAIKRARTRDMRIDSLKEYLAVHTGVERYPPDLKLLGQVIKKVESKSPDSIALIKNWATSRYLPPSTKMAA